VFVLGSIRVAFSVHICSIVTTKKKYDPVCVDTLHQISVSMGASLAARNVPPEGQPFAS
jgi:hypothetical protein